VSREGSRDVVASAKASKSSFGVWPQIGPHPAGSTIHSPSNHRAPVGVVGDAEICRVYDVEHCGSSVSLRSIVVQPYNVANRRTIGRCFVFGSPLGVPRSLLVAHWVSCSGRRSNARVCSGSFSSLLQGQHSRVDGPIVCGKLSPYCRHFLLDDISVISSWEK
jgi:hypothetical protein